jgi:hypothetical protein
MKWNAGGVVGAGILEAAALDRQVTAVAVLIDPFADGIAGE